MRAWLATRGHASAASPAEELRTTLRLHGRSGSGVGDDSAELLLLVPAAAHHSPDTLAATAGLSDADLAAHAKHDRTAVADAALGSGANTTRFAADDADILRALYSCVREEGGQAALGVLAEWELEDSAASGAYRTPEPLTDLIDAWSPASRRGARELYGQDVLPVQARRSAVGLTLTAPTATVTVRADDSLRADAFPDLLVDAVLSNPPYGIRDWGHDELAYDPRWAYGVPARAESELAWVQHALAHLTPGGYAVLLLPPATAGRASGRRVRAELVRGGALRAMVALPVGASMPLHVGLQIWVLQRPEPGGVRTGSRCCSSTRRRPLTGQTAWAAARRATAHEAAAVPPPWTGTRSVAGR